MSPSRSRATRVFTITLALIATACGPERTPTVPVLPEDALLAAGGNGGGGNKVKLRTVTLTSTTMTIGGAGVDYPVQIRNPGTSIGPWILLQGEIVQNTAQGGEVRRGAGGMLVNCGSGIGTLPTTGNGVCSMQLTASASGQSGPDGVLTPGLARFVLQLLNAPPNVAATELDTRTIDVTLVGATAPAPTITSISPTFSQLVIGGTSASASIEINNPGPQRSTVIVQGWIRQGSALRAANGDNVSCGGAAGVLPSGTCTTSTSVVASNIASGIGTLIPGTATLEIQLKQIEGTTETTLDTKTVSVTLSPLTPIIAREIVPGVVQIGVPGTITLILSNPIPTTYSNTTVAVNFLQAGVPAPTGPGGLITCGGTAGQLPPGDCVENVSFQVGSEYSAGPATLELRLYTANGTVLLDVKQFSVLIAAAP